MDLFDIKKISLQYDVQEMSSNHIDIIFNLFATNAQYSEYCGISVTKEIIAEDIVKYPQGFNQKNKHYLGFFQNDNLIAIMDILLGYPDDDSVWLGFFMVDGNNSNKGVGSSIINEFINWCVSLGFTRVGLGYEKTNPQSSHFWNKNRFITEKIVDTENGNIAVAYKQLYPKG